MRMGAKRWKPPAPPIFLNVPVESGGRYKNLFLPTEHLMTNSGFQLLSVAIIQLLVQEQKRKPMIPIQEHTQAMHIFFPVKPRQIAFVRMEVLLLVPMT